MATTTPETTSTVQEIDRARADMGRALFVLGDRIAPKKLIARVKENVKLKASAKVAELKERYNPVEMAKRKIGGSKPKVIETRLGGSRPGLPR